MHDSLIYTFCYTRVYTKRLKITKIIDNLYVLQYSKYDTMCLEYKYAIDPIGRLIHLFKFSVLINSNAEIRWMDRWVDRLKDGWDV